MLDDTILDALLAHHLAIVGKTGTGKTYVGKLLVEHELRLKRRMVIIDPTGVWWGLRSSADGKKAGFPIAVFGGQHGDRTLSPEQGAELARILAATNLPAILDLSEMLLGEQQRFVAAFAEHLFQANKGAIRLVIDEADQFAPQNPMPEMKRQAHQIDRIVRRGRARGFYVTMITQRPAAIAKNVLTQSNALVALRLTAPQDRKALLDWVEGSLEDATAAKAFRRELPKLPLGYGWAWAPENDILQIVEWPRISTYDSGRTPEHGEEIMPPATLADVDLSALDAVAPEGTSLSNIVPSIVYRADPHEIEEAEKRGERQGRRVGYSEGFAAARTFMAKAMADMEREQLLADHQVDRPKAPYSVLSAEAVIAANQTAGDAVARRKPHSTEAGHVIPPDAKPAFVEGSLTPSAKRILAELQARYPRRFTWTQIATLTGLAPRGGSFNTARKALRGSGFIIEEGDMIAANGRPEDPANPWPAPRTPDEVLQDWLSKLPTSAADMLRILAIVPEPIDRIELGAMTGRQPRGGSFNTGVATLRRNELIIEEGGRIVAVPELRSQA